MPTRIELWRCNICIQTYNDPISAKECEAKGVPEIPPRGLIITEHIFRDQEMRNLYTGVVTGEAKVQGHSVRPFWWWFRGNNYRDDPWGLEAKGRAGVCLNWENANDTNLLAPSSLRAIKACEEMGIKPLVVRDGRIVPLDDS